MTCRATSVPVSRRSSAAIATACRSDAASPIASVVAPVTVAGLGRRLGRSDRATSSSGPPVITGTGSTVWSTVVPSMIVANSA